MNLISAPCQHKLPEITHSYTKQVSNKINDGVVEGKQAPRRLISVGLNGAIIDWDLITLQPRKIIDVGDIAIWDCDLSQGGKKTLKAIKT
jgi:hypothetical protein